MADEVFVFDRPISGSAQITSEIRNNFNALAQNNATATEDNPPEPRNGMTRFLASDPDNIKYQVFWDSWRTLIEYIGGSVIQARRTSKIFTSVQQWVFDHNLGIKPMVQVVLSTGKVVLPEDISHATINRVIVEHAGLQSGEIIVVG